MTDIEIEAPSVCFACGKPAGMIRVGAMGPGYRACVDCYLRFGRKELGNEADRLFLLALSHPKYGKCLHCGAQVLHDVKTGSPPLQCQGCDRELLRLMSEKRAQRQGAAH